MTIFWIYALAAVLPIIMVPLLLPKIALMARRKNITDKPNERKLQRAPVMVTGGTVLIAVLCFVLLVLNVFYPLDNLFSVVCVMVVFYLLGMLDDTIGLSYQFKFLGQIVCVLLLFLCSDCRINIPMSCAWMSFAASLVCSLGVGLLLINAMNFIDGIDGLASGIGILAGVAIAWWNVCHGQVAAAVIAIAMVGALFAFFFFNVYSVKFKMYLGDSGSLVLGAIAYMALSVNSSFFYFALDWFDVYSPSFFIAVFSVVVFDLVRVVFLRLSLRHSPFVADRNHLHHILVDVGFTHRIASLLIIVLNLLVIGVWFATASMGIVLWLQTCIVVAVAIVLIWLPFIGLYTFRKRQPDRFAQLHHRLDNMMYFDRKVYVFIQQNLDRVVSLVNR